VTAVDDRVDQLTRNATELIADLREIMISPEITAQVDPVGFGDAVVRAAASLAARPGVIASAMGGYSANSAHAVLASLLRSLGIKVAGPAEVPDKDRRHADPAYDSNGWYFFARQSTCCSPSTFDGWRTRPRSIDSGGPSWTSPSTRSSRRVTRPTSRPATRPCSSGPSKPVGSVWCAACETSAGTC
jgi:hypothetical protein